MKATLRIARSYIPVYLLCAGFLLFIFNPAAAQEEEPLVLVEEDFSEFEVGGQPELDAVRPNNNVGADESFPIPFGSAVGALVVGPESEPASSLPNGDNQSLRLYDYTDGDIAYAGMNFVDVASRRDVRLDFRFQRSTSFSRFSDEDGLYVTIGARGEVGEVTHTDAGNRNFELRLFNDGGYIAAGATSESGNFETGGDLGVHDVSIFANADAEESLEYEGPQGSVTLPGLAVNVYINGSRVVEEMQMRHDRRVGKVAFMAGDDPDKAEIDFIIDDVVISELRREDPPALPFPEFFEDFSEREVGEQPRDLFGTGNNIRPSSNSGQDAELPLQGSGAVGVVVVDETTEPVPAIDGRSLRMYDYSGDIAFAQHRFLRQPTEERPDIRFDFQFRRSAGFARTSDSERVMVSMGEQADGDTLRTNAPKAFEVRIWNDGMIGTGASGTSDEFRYEDEDAEELGVHDVTVYANSGENVLVFEDLNEEERSLDPYSFTTFVNGELIDENRGFRGGSDNTPLGSFAIQTGTGMAAENMDMVFDNIRVSQFLGDDELDLGQPGVPDEILFSQVPLGRTWGSDPMPGAEVAIRAEVRDAFNVPLAGREVTFSVDTGGGSLAEPTTVETDVDGAVRVVYTTAEGDPETASIRASVGEIDDLWDVASTLPGPVTDIEATGGSVSTFSDEHGEFRVHTFTNEGADTFEITSGSGEIEVLVVAGGGGGGGSSNNRWGGAGAGAGGLIQTVLGAESGTYDLAVGAGGAGGVGDSNAGEQGEDSVFGDLVALGGARARGQNNQYDGGSGSGGAPQSSTAAHHGGRGLQPESASGGFGNDGGWGTEAIGNDRAGGGGGGAGSPGGDAGPSTGGDGGDGWLSFITGTGVYYAGGGGGAGRHVGGEGGLGGGGGGTVDGDGESAAPNTGGGGGASSLGEDRTGGDGGSGIVVVRYKIGEAPDVSDPDPDRVPTVTAGRVSGTDDLRLSWLSLEGQTYLLQRSENLTDWEDTDASFEGDGTVLEHILEGLGDDPREFFRLLIEED